MPACQGSELPPRQAGVPSYLLQPICQGFPSLLYLTGQWSRSAGLVLAVRDRELPGRVKGGLAQLRHRRIGVELPLDDIAVAREHGEDDRLGVEQPEVVPGK